MGKTQKIGQQGEQKAKQYLLDKGYTIVAQNFRHKQGEIDLIALHQETLVFVEVRFRKNALFGFPEQTISPAKKQKIKQVAEYYVTQNAWHKDIRFDIIAIVQKPIFEIEHFEDAFF